MSTTSSSGNATVISFFRISRVPFLGGLIGIVSAVFLLALIRHIEADTGHHQHVPALVTMIVLISYAAVGAFAATILLPKPQ